MQIERSLAARKIVAMSSQGFGPKECIKAAAKLVKSQGFSAKYSKQVAEQMAGLVL